MLLGAALSPTDPVFAAAIVGREEVPQRLRYLLNVESGLNDGLALPVVVALLAIAAATARIDPAALLVFGGLISPGFLAEIHLSGYVFAFLVLVRPFALGIGLLGSRLDWPERAVVAWFGPKGFASVVYGILILKADIARGDELFHLLAVIIAGSIIAHSSTDVMIARWFRKVETE